MKGSFLLLSCAVLLLALPACKTYSTISIPPNKAEIGSLYFDRPHVSLHDNYEKNQYWLNQMRVVEDSIMGMVVPASQEKMHVLHKSKFGHSQKFETDPLKTIHLYTSIDSLDVGQTGFSLYDINSVEIHELNHGAQTGKIIGIVLGTVVVVAGVTLAIACNCPEVSSLSEDDAITHGSLFPGSILHTLERTDYVPLTSPLYRSGDELRLKVANARAEEQFIDELKVLNVHHASMAHIGISNEDKLLTWDREFSPGMATSDSVNVTNLISTRDGQHFGFDDVDVTNDLVSIELEFNREDLIENPALVIHGKQSKWLDSVAQYVFYKAGRGLDKWVDRKDDGNPRKLRSRSIKRGMSLNVYVQRKGKWDYAGSFTDAGTSSEREMAMPVDLSAVDDFHVRIKLESAFRIWEVDFAGLTNTWTQNLVVDTVPFISAVNQDGVDMLPAIGQADGNYAVQSDIGDFIELELKTGSSAGSTLVMQGHGYYHYLTDYEHKGDLGFFLAFRRKDGLHNLSIEMNDYLKTLSGSSAETNLNHEEID